MTHLWVLILATEHTAFVTVNLSEDVHAKIRTPLGAHAAFAQSSYDYIVMF